MQALWILIEPLNDDSAAAMPCVYKGVTFFKQTLTRRCRDFCWSCAVIDGGTRNHFAELQPWMKMIMAHITGAVFPGAIPVGFEGFEREQRVCVLPPPPVLGGTVRLRALPHQHPHLSSRESYSSSYLPYWMRPK